MVSRIPGLDMKKDIHERTVHVLNNYSEADLFHLLVQLQIKADMVDKLREENRMLEDKYWRLQEETEEIKNHWRILHCHLEKNPSLKEEWNNFCMAIKLTED